MSEKRFHQFGLWVIDNPNFNGISIADLVDTEIMSITEVVNLLNEQQAIITEYEDFCYNLCMFIIGKDLDDEFREKYGKEYNIITKWKGCGSDE